MDQEEKLRRHKLIAGISLTVAGAGLVWLGVSRFGKEDDYSEAKAAIKTESEILKKSSMQLTYPPSQYSSWAEVLYDGMKSFFDLYSTKESVIEVMIQMQNTLDYNTLYDAFGTRVLDKTWLFPGVQADLDQALQGELSKKQLNQLNKLYQERGINRKFLVG